MFTMAIGLRGQAKSEKWMPTKALRLAALLGALVLVSIAVEALTVLAHSNLRQQSSSTGDCSLISEGPERLACYDKLARRPMPHPFRGANAPVLDPSL
jgi:hypothetical protein